MNLLRIIKETVHTITGNGRAATLTDINTIDDLLRLLDENEQFRAAVRNKILTEDLIRLPSQFEEQSQKADERMEQMQFRLDSLMGYALEDKMPSRLRQRLERAFDLKNVRTVWLSRGAVQPPSRGQSFSDMIETALSERRLTDRDASRIIDTDMIVAALKNSDSSQVYIAIEASGVIQNYDVERARLTANIMANLSLSDAIPAVYGFSIAEQQETLARPNAQQNLAEVHIFMETENL